MQLLILLLLGCLLSVEAKADPKSLGAWQGWSAYLSEQNGQKICYISARPLKSEGDYKKRSAVYAQVTNRPAEHRTGIFNMLGGYIYKKGTSATLEIGGKTFTLFTHGDAAFAQDQDDPKIVAAMQHADSMIVKGTSSHGTVTVDSFSLKGMQTAYSAINKACDKQSN